MLRRIYDYQKLFYRSTPSPGFIQANMSSVVLMGFAYWFGFFLLLVMTSNILLPATLIAGVNVVERHFNGDKPLFKTVPVSRKFAFFNVYLATVVMICGVFLAMMVSFLVINGLLYGLSFVTTSVSWDGISDHIPRLTLQGIMFWMLLSVIVQAVSTSIVFLQRKRRVGGFATLYAICFGLMVYLRRIMPPVEEGDFLVRLSLMPHINMILAVLGLLALIIVPASVYTAYRAYVVKPPGSRAAAQ